MLQAQSLSRLPGIRHGFFTRAGGVSDGLYESLNGGVGSEDAPAKVAENRARMAQAPRRCAGAFPHLLPDPFADGGGGRDAVAGERPAPRRRHRHPRARPRHRRLDRRLRAGAARRSARRGVIGAAHAGWRGALTGVIEATVAAMEKLGAERERIVAAAGPMIRQPSYEVGQDLIDRFVALEPNTVRFFKPAQRPGHAMFDLAGYVVSTIAAGRGRGRSRTSGFAPMPIRRSSIPTAAPPTGPSPIMAGISTRSRWPINHPAVCSGSLIHNVPGQPGWTGGPNSGYQFLTQARRVVKKMAAGRGGCVDAVAWSPARVGRVAA